MLKHVPRITNIGCLTGMAPPCPRENAQCAKKGRVLGLRLQRPFVLQLPCFAAGLALMGLGFRFY